MTHALLIAKTKNGYTPSCQRGPNKKDCDKINGELNRERANLPQSYVAQTAPSSAAASSAQSQRLFKPQESNSARANNSNHAPRI